MPLVYVVNRHTKRRAGAIGHGLGSGRYRRG